ncbi:MAG TPA: mandelate racemase/muconate lactonizing enzyme family protein [Tepidisphaeraceae bacterium]|nr:mandelate racemase/muconate lactonizing enzyme family protein [Tepidisphaeraceae bacterium]
MITRREWLGLGGSALIAAALSGDWSQAQVNERYEADFDLPMFDIPGQIKTPVKIESIELLKRGSNYFVRTRSTDGAVGISPTKQVEDFIPIFRHLVAPYFIGKDARDIETLVNGVYVENYKMASIPFWCPVAYCEQSCLDLLGRVANKSVGAMLGGVVRNKIPVYLSGSDRILKAEDEVDVYVRGVAATGAKAVKFKIGGRMSGDLDAYPGRTETVLHEGRKRLGDKIILYADANGSYDAKKGIEIGKMMESLDYRFFEEPCPFEWLSETQEVAKALKIPVAFGEQNYSLWQFQWALTNGVMRIVQPDINYNGGLIRAARVAKIARKLGRTIVPHNTQTGVSSVNIVQFGSHTPNIGDFLEYPWRQPQRAESWFTPNFMIKDGFIDVPPGPGLGIEIAPDYLATAEVVVKIEKRA